MEETAQITTGRNPIPVPLLEERREYTISLKLAGLSTASILKQINAEARAKGWGEVTRRTVERDVAAYFRQNRALTIQDYDHLEQMRLAFLAQMELTIEKASLHIANKNRAKKLFDKDGKVVYIGDWKPFEYMDALDKLHRMQMNYMEAQNWNLGRKNPIVAIQQNNIYAMYDDVSAEIKQAKPEAIKQLSSIFETALDKMRGSPQEE